MQKTMMLFAIALVLTLGLTSCGGASKRASKYIEKNSGKIEEFIKGRKVNPSRAKKLFENQSRVVPCARCSQQGFLFRVDNYGNILTDYNGNVLVVTCPNCGGKGVVQVSN